MLQYLVILYCFVLPFTTGATRPQVFASNQRYPNKDESEVCGRIRDVIPRDSGRYRKILIRNTNDEALYANDDCRRMTSRAKSKLDVLASRVSQYWSGKKVRVLQAWTDQIDPNDKTSLHYEGRSLRLELSNSDSNQLGRLAGFAAEAGFDWVHNTNDKKYIRASVIPDVCQTSVDLVFLLDGSGSVGANNFLKVKNFVKKVVDFFNIGPTGTHIAVATYETSSHTEFKLNEFYTKTKLREEIDDIYYRGYLTYTGEALNYVRNNIFTKAAGMRTDPGIPKVLVLLTDGYSNGISVYDPAENLKKLGVSIFSVGVGSSVSVTELNDIATDPDSSYVFQLDSFNDLADWVDRLSAVSCSEGALIKSCDDSVTTVTSGSFKYFRTEFDVVTDDRVSVEIRDQKGINHLYASATSKNPGPLDPDSVKNEDNNSPRAVSVKLHGTKTLFVAVQGQSSENKFSLSFWDNLFAQSNYEVNVMEDISPKFVTQLKMNNDSYSLAYSITDGDDDNIFKIEANSPRISTTKTLDREIQSQYNLVIVAEDTKNKCHRSRTLVQINVTDDNDNAPKFSQASYTASIQENAQSGTVVKTVQATDLDSGANGRITYSITSGDTSLFRIDSNGDVILKGSLNYENKSSYSISVKAEDGGNPSKYDVATLTVTILNVNENPSINCVGSCNMKISEAVSSGTVGKVKSSDPDTKTVCTLQYSISSNARDSFSVDTNGVLKTKKSLDREVTPQFVFFVTVQDCGSPPLSDSVRVTVTIEDVNDNDPQFAGPYDVDILENEIVGSNVVQVKAIDDDEGANGEVRYSLDPSVSLIFHIDSVSGAVTTKVKLDYETRSKYSFTVTATDQGTGGRTGTTVVTVNVVDINDNKPVFQNLPYTANILEDSSTGTFVTSVKANDTDSGLGGDVIYSIISGNHNDAFVIDANSGNISVKSALNRETRSSYSVVVQASDRGSPSQHARATVTITIDDVNDNSPVFLGLPYSTSVSENTNTDQSIFKVLASDDDDSTYGQVSYSIKTDVNNTFAVDGNGNIILKKKLDYETTKVYTFTIVASDGGGKKTEANVKITVEDYNDNPPDFEKDLYTPSVAENVNIGHTVDTVKATDKDSGPRGSVTYSITSGNVGNAFTISASGAVTVSFLLDRETTESYSLTIKATDGGSPSMSSTTRMDITVTDINDNKPTFGRSSYSFTIAEGNTENDEVGSLGPATDKDKGPNAEIVYSIVSGNTGVAFEFQSSGKLIAKVVLDRESIPAYDLVIEAKDKGTPSLYTRVPVQIVVMDKNDNTPDFSQKPYNCQISENSAENSFVCFVHASDGDEGVNGTVTYELVTPSSTFGIDQNNGEIKAKVTLDREQNPSYTFTVRAKDGGIPFKSSTVTVNVKVLDENDNEPLFNQTKYEFDVSEDASPSKVIGRVLATDKDEGLNKQVVYSMVAGNVNNAFEIDPNTGDILVKSKLDRETISSYTLTVQATDQGSPSLFSSRLVFITVQDVNDNSPQFIGAPYIGVIAEDASVGSTVVQVKASDDDDGVNGLITYNISRGLNNDHFTIEKDSGVIRTAKVLDYETISSYEIYVTATDGGAKSTTTRVDINVENKNDNAPAFVSSSPTVSISEGVAIGTNVVQFNATDEDGGTLTFSILSGNTADALTLDKDSGLLTTGKELDREAVPWYNLTVTVNDKDGQSSSANLTVIVLDVNDNTPVFEPSSYAKDVTENTGAGSIITVTATDKDEGPNGKISYSIDSTSAQKFTIGSTSGVISTKNPLDHEAGARYVIQVTAKDSGTPSLSSVATVVVTVLDTNDNKPFFKNDVSISLRENTAKDETIFRVEATDIDSGVNGEIVYTITSGNSAGFFSLDASNGNLKVAKPVDRETNPSFTLTVVASNKVPYSGSPPNAKTSATVKITIEDVNDNAPAITNTVYKVDVQENSKASTLVVDVDATDADTGVNSEILYEIVAGNVKDVFGINADSGIVTVKGSLDRETLALYTLTIRASDKGTPSLYSEKDFTVNITDVDDNVPVFTAKSYDASVDENVKVFTSVIELKATDEDTGVNSKLKYSILSGNTKGHFRIDSATGNVSTNAPLDYENIQQYKLVVTAKDTVHTTQVDLNIRVVNINDNDPIFQPARYTPNVPENIVLNKLVVTVKATDADPFGGLTYTIVSGNNENKFSLDPSSGELTVAAGLDRETTDFYNITVRVTDGGVPSRDDLAVVEISVTDINDNDPKFNRTSIQGKVTENSKDGVEVLTVHATDRDLGKNAEIQYSITKGNTGNVFTLDSISGVLSVNARIDRENDLSFTLEITAEDKGSSPRPSMPLRVDIVVGDENDNDPAFSKASYHRNVTENLSAGTFVEEVEATDEDFGLNAQIVYSILSGSSGHFTIDNETGVIETTVPLNRENIPSYVITIEAKDRGTPPRKSTVKLYVNVVDANDNSPVFNLSSLEANVTEEQPKGLYVTKVMATDSDSGANSEITYRLTSVLGRSKLKIDPETGVVTTLMVFDYEQEKQYVFQVTATDKGKPSLTATANLVVNVVDIDDNCPEFFPKVYNVTIPENLPYNHHIINVTATDKDSGSNKNLDYGIRSGDSHSSFNIDAYTGVITPGLQVDREISPKYHLVVRAGGDYCGVNVTEGEDETTGGPLSKSVADVFITVTDLNDNAPEFLEKTYQYIFSDIYTTSLLWLNASDPDEGMNAQVQFSLNSVKRVDSQRTLSVFASDRGDPPMTSNTTLTVKMAERVTCEAMSFDVSLAGHVTVKTLCIFERTEISGEALVGESIQFDCSAKGNTKPEYLWTRNGIQLGDWSERGQYEIKSLSKDDTGDYRCIATSAAGTILSKKIEIIVKEAPSIVVHPKDTWGELGKKTVLHCLAKGDKTIEYLWYRDNTLMTATGDLIVNKPDLVFPKTIRADTGEYYCEAKNDVIKEPARSHTARLKVFSGESVVNLNLVVDKPYPEKSCQYFNITDLKEHLKHSMLAEVAVVEFNKPSTLCNLTQCYNNPCKNRGQCQATETGYTCECPRGWTGTNCEQDENECATSDIETCINNGTCVNRPGSFSCTCVANSFGKRCQFIKKTCEPNPCPNGQKCYPKETAQRYECLSNVVTVSMVFKLDKSRRPWQDWMKYDVAKEIENMIQNAREKQGDKGKRKRRDADVPDYSACSVRVLDSQAKGTEEVELEIVLVCTSAPSKDYICQAMLDEGKVSSCIGDKGTVTETKPTQAPIQPERLTVSFIALADDGKVLDADEAIDRVDKTDLEARLGKNGMTGMELTQRSSKTAKQDSGLSAGAIAGVSLGVIALIIVAIAIVFVLLRTRKNKADSRFSMKNRSIHAQSSRTKILNKDISLKELEKSESRGVDNKTFSRIYEHPEEGDHDSEDGHSFMIENQKLSPKKEDLKYMEEIESAPWYHGSVSRAKAESVLETSEEGTFLVRCGISTGEFYISTRCSEDGPKYRHVAVNRREKTFVAVCGPDGEAQEFTTFHELIDYLRSTPTRYEDGSPDLLLKDHVN